MTVTKNILIAQRYSDALVAMASEGKLTFGKIGADLNLISETLSQSSDLADFLVNPLVSVENKKEILSKVFSEEIDALTLTFLKILVDKGRFGIFPEVLEAYNKALDDIENIQRVSVTSAVEMSDESKSKLKEKLESKLNKSVTFSWDVNPEIIAGLIVSMGDNVIDMSLRHKLENLSKSII